MFPPQFEQMVSDQFDFEVTQGREIEDPLILFGLWIVGVRRQWGW